MKADSAGAVVSFLDQSIEEFATCLQDFELDFRQLESGFFNARTTAIDLGGALIKRRTTSLRYALKGSLPDGLIFYFPLKPLSKIINGCQIDPGIQLVSTSARFLFSVVPGHYDHLLVCIRRQDLALQLGESGAADFVQRAAAVDLCRVNAHRKLSLTRRLFEMYAGILNGARAPDAQQCHDLQRTLIELLYDYLLAHGQLERTQPGTQGKLLQRALALVEKEPTRAFSLDELSKEVFASKRALQYTFNSLV